MNDLSQLFKNNAQWVKKNLEKNPDYFKNLSQPQRPKYLWIGCSDSRVPTTQAMGLEIGELFIHRNIANLCMHTDFSFLSVLEFAIKKLHIEHVIVCGHYGCAGVASALINEELGLVDNWLRNIRDLYFQHTETLNNLPNHETRFKQLVELNVKKQVKNICHTSIVQHTWKASKPLTIHGWVYDLESGLLKDLKTSNSSLEHIDSCYQTT